MNDIKKQNISVQFERIKSFEVGDDRFIKCKVWIAHTGVNQNNWIFTKDSLVGAIPSLTNIPIVAFVQKNDESQDDFSDHREVMEIDKGKIKISYKGKAIGVVTSDNNAKIESKTCEDGVTREFLTCEGLLWSKFDDSVDIFMRDECKDQSMEIDNYVGTFNKYKQFECTGFRFTGLCCLGCGVEPAMSGACVDINFSVDEIKTKLELFNAHFTKQSQTQFSDDINNNTNTEGGINVLNKEMIDNILAEFSVSLDSINFEIKDTTTEEELRNYLAEFTKTSVLSDETIDSVLAEFEVTKEEIGEFASDITEEDFKTLVSDFACKKKAKMSKENAKPSAVFSTYNEKRELLRGVLKREEKRDDDGRLEYALDYWIADFDDNFVYVEKEEYNGEKWTYSKGRFAYTIADNVANITSEFEPMIVKWVTLEENAKIEKARATFESQTAEFERLKQFEKDTLSAQFESSVTTTFSKFDDKLTNVTEYDVLKTNHTDMSLEQIEEKCFAILGKQNANFSVQSSTTPVVNLGLDTENQEPEDDGYGGLLSRKYNN